jgi:hypothetical protein
MYAEGTPEAEYNPAWREVEVASFPATIVAKAEAISRKHHPEPSKAWHGNPGALRAFESAYGDRRVLWLSVHDGRHRWEWIGFTPEGEDVEYIAGSRAESEPAPSLREIEVLRQQ